MLHFDAMYPAVPVEFLQTMQSSFREEIDETRERSFGLQKIINPLRRENAVGITLNAPLRHRGLETDEREQARWYNKYCACLRRNLEDFPRLLDTDHWKISLFTHPKSIDQVAPGFIDEICRNEFVEIHVMANASETLSPATLWRFLPLSDLTLNELLILDIDESWEQDVTGWYTKAAAYGMPLTRAHHIPRKGHWLNLLNPWSIIRGSINNYLPIMASKILARPRELALGDIASLMAAYIVLRKQRVEAGFPCSQLFDNEPLTPYNMPYESMPMGFGNHWCGYSFDERFLAHVIFHHFVDRGALCTICIDQYAVEDLPSHLRQYNLKEFLADYAYIHSRSRENIIVNHGARLEDSDFDVITAPIGEMEAEPPGLDFNLVGQIVPPGGHRKMIPDVEFHPSGRYIVVSSWAENELLVYSARGGRPRLLQRIGHSESGLATPHSISFSPAGDRMIVNGYRENALFVFNLTDGEHPVNPRPVRRYDTPRELFTRTPHSQDMTPDGRFLACAYCDGPPVNNKIVIYQVEDAGNEGYSFNAVVVLTSTELEDANPKGLAFAPGGRALVLTLADTDNLVLYDFDRDKAMIVPEPKQVLRNPESELFHPEDICFSRCGEYCLVTNAGGNNIGVFRFDPERGRFRDSRPLYLLGRDEFPFNYPHGLCFSPDGQQLLVTDYGYYKHADTRVSSRDEPGKLAIIEIRRKDEAGHIF